MHLAAESRVQGLRIIRAPVEQSPYSADYRHRPKVPITYYIIIILIFADYRHRLKVPMGNGGGARTDAT